MKTLSLLTLTALLSVAACSHGQKSCCARKEAKACCSKESCPKDQKCCATEKKCDDGSCARKS
jgi:hypothetical protein